MLNGINHIIRMKYNIAIIGLGYVGLPLALQFSKKFNVIGIDIDSYRVDQLNNFNDKTNEVEKKFLKKSLNRKLITKIKVIRILIDIIANVSTVVA